MPNHIHILLTRFETDTLAEIMQAFKSITSHKANKSLSRSGQFWMLDVITLMASWMVKGLTWTAALRTLFCNTTTRMINDGAGYLVMQYTFGREQSGNRVRYNISENDGRKNSYGGIQVWGDVRNADIHNNVVFMTPPADGSPRAITLQSNKQALFFENVGATNVHVQQCISNDGRTCTRSSWRPVRPKCYFKEMIISMGTAVFRFSGMERLILPFPIGALPLGRSG